MGRKTKSLMVFGLMLFLALLSWLRDVTGIRSAEDLNALAEEIVSWSGWVLGGALLLAILAWRIRRARSQFTPYKKRRATSHHKRKVHQVPRNVKPVLEYWRQSVQDGQRMAFSEREVEAFGNLVTREQVISGHLEARLVELLARRSAEVTNRPATTDTIKILVAPICLKKLPSRGIDESDLPQTLIPFWAAASLKSNGELLPPRAYPWIPRIYLEPLVTDSGLVLGEVERLESFAAKNPLEDGISWNSYWKLCEGLFRHVCGDKFADFTLEDYERTNHSLVILDSTAFGGSINVERIYNDILDGRSAVGLAGTFANLKTPKRRSISTTKSVTSRAALLHCGQFEGSFSLFPSQRQAVHQTLLLKPNEVLAVTGPPGTGKTTLIQSVVASLWVTAAQERNAYPQFIVSCSATNQATMNVIHSFGKAHETPGPLSGRWLPEFESYGTFCSSETKSRDKLEIPYTLLDGSGSLAEFENLDYIKGAEGFYLERFSAAFSKTRNIASAISQLQKELRTEYSKLYRNISTARSSSQSDEQFFNSLAAFDPTHRHRLFQLATHYWEGRWLLAAPDFVSACEDGTLVGNKGRLLLQKFDWQIRAMLTPCFVSTFSMAPKFFGGRAAEDSPPIDLLIADEAGQVNPEIGAATYSLAEKGLVIGDIAQLEPVWTVPQYADFGNLTSFGLYKPGKELQLAKLEASGMLASSGSLMKLALSVCAVGNETEPGVFLSEHRRSVPEIVRFANTLSYANRLVPKRAKLEHRILPAFGYADIRGESATSGKSRLNKPEADSIANWLGKMRETLEKTYNLPIAEVVAVITPFAAQTRYLKTQLLKKYPQMTIGTINSLQGAERPIVIFSPVYDNSHRADFIFDKTPNMLNVAVSRAKDSFLVFGDKRIFRTEGQSPSAILGQFLFADQNNELSSLK